MFFRIYWPVKDLSIPPFIYRIYTIAVLLVATVLSPISLSFVPLIIILGYIYQWRFRSTPFLDFLTHACLLFILELLFASHIGPYFALLVALPLLLTINHGLLVIGQKTRLDFSGLHHRRFPTNLLMTLAALNLVMLLISIVTASLPLLIIDLVMILYISLLCLISIKGIKFDSLSLPEKITLRVVAGQEREQVLYFSYKSKLPGTLFVTTSDNWYHVMPFEFIKLEYGNVELKIKVKPLLSGTHKVRLRATIIDPWGLISVSFEIEPVELIVIPRAKYAEWLAQKYLTGVRSGVLPLVSRISNVLARNGLRRGVEFYGLRLYQPGDSLKNIDWKHSVKYNELVSREFNELQVLPVIVLVNLVAGDEEEMDKLAYNVIVTAICLAQDNVPAALAAYNDKGTVLITEALSSNALVTGALQLARQIEIHPRDTRFLKPPDIIRLRASINRLEQSDCMAARVMRDLLQIEYKYLSRSARNSPCTATLNEVLYRNNRQSTVLIVSGYNHDTEALAFHSYVLSRKGNVVVNV